MKNLPENVMHKILASVILLGEVAGTLNASLPAEPVTDVDDVTMCRLMIWSKTAIIWS